ncbi:AraC family transcriptional regulator [Anaerosporobacter faecicola]|uniref:AraC family transcriptional regulator n=1 Tax=Anaerosporobacter faecicola TaxID=2718714 RepID=UPI00143AA068|nr:AraC family transcriptional regulator [Anaerosporobacter faecicola]
MHNTTEEKVFVYPNKEKAKRREKEKNFEEKVSHGTAEIPIALHKLTYPEGTDMIFYLHWHREMELLVVTEGSMELQVEEIVYRLKKGDCIFINSNMYHSAKSIGKVQCSFYAVVFSDEFLQTDVHSHYSKHYIRPVLKGKRIFTPVIQEDGDWQSKILGMLEEIHVLDHRLLLEHELMLKTRMYAIWELYFEHGKENDAINDDNSINLERIRPVLEYIEDNYAYEISLSDLAALIPMSEGQFCRVFRRTMSRTPMQYIMRYRILQSCHLLTETNEKIAEVANQSGFNNISYYNKVFLSIVGCTPKQYRNANF